MEQNPRVALFHQDEQFQLLVREHQHFSQLDLESQLTLELRQHS